MPPGGAAHVPSALKKLAVPPPLATTPPLAEDENSGICAGGIVPDQVNASVPEVVMGEPETASPVGTVAATEVTVPLPPPPPPPPLQQDAAAHSVPVHT